MPHQVKWVVGKHMHGHVIMNIVYEPGFGGGMTSSISQGRTSSFNQSDLPTAGTGSTASHVQKDNKQR